MNSTDYCLNTQLVQYVSSCLEMRDSLISYQTGQFSKIFLTKILLHRPYEAFENSNTDIEGLSSHLWKIYTPVVFWVEYRRELCFPWEEVFKAARDENFFHPVVVLFRKQKKNEEKMGGRTSAMCMEGRK